jgi:hypothetical protein
VDFDYHILATIGEFVVGAIVVFVAVRLGLTSAWKQAAEGWKARSEESERTVNEAKAERDALAARLVLVEAAMAAKPDLEEHAKILHSTVEMLERISVAMTRLEDRIELHEAAAERRATSILDAVAAVQVKTTPPTRR